MHEMFRTAGYTTSKDAAFDMENKARFFMCNIWRLVVHHGMLWQKDLPQSGQRIDQIICKLRENRLFCDHLALQGGLSQITAFKVK